MSSKLISKDLHVIATELLQAKNEWRQIGTALGIQVHDIKGINGTDPQQALTDMLSTVLQRKSLTWGQIIDALRDPLVLHTELANEIAYKYDPSRAEEEPVVQKPSVLKGKRKSQEQPEATKKRRMVTQDNSSSKDDSTDGAPPTEDTVSNPKSQDDSIDSETPGQKKRKRYDSPDSGEIKRIKSGNGLKTPGRPEPPYKYTMAGRPHGNALIINNVNYHVSEYVRKGSDKDKEALEKVLETLGYVVESVDDLPTADDIKTTVVEHANKNSNPDSFICCILAHGEEGAIVGLDGSTIKIADISRALVDPQKPCQKYLHQKPKIFFIQACQGRDTPSKLDCTIGVPTDPSLPVENLDTGIPSLPRDSDFFYGFASSSETSAARNEDHGASYIQTLCNVLETHYKDEDLVTMVTRVHFKEAKHPHNIGKTKPLYHQQPQLVSTLRGQVKFN